jgi:hypothetical protein
LCYKKKKTTFQDISYTQQEGIKEVHEEVLARKHIVAPHDTLDDKFRVVSEEDPTKSFEENKEEKHKHEEEVNAPHVEKSKQAEPRAKVDLYRHPHHREKQQPSRQEHAHQHTYYGPTRHQRSNKNQDQGGKETIGLGFTICTRRSSPLGAIISTPKTMHSYNYLKAFSEAREISTSTKGVKLLTSYY